MRIAHGVEMLDLHMLVNGTENHVCPVLISDNDDVMLVDTGYPGQLQQIREAMGTAGIPFQQINRIIITHHDLDHIGCLAGIVNELQGKAEVISHIVEKPFVQGDIQPLKLIQMEARLDSLSEQMKSLYEGMKRGYALSMSKVDRTVDDGDEIPFCGGIKIIHTAGHTHGHISLYLKQSKTLISGDTMFVEGGMLVPAPSFANFNNDLAKESLKKLTMYDIENVVCYHGGFFGDNPNQRIAELVRS